MKRSPLITLLTGAALGIGLWIASMVAASPAPAGYGTPAAAATATVTATAPYENNYMPEPMVVGKTQFDTTNVFGIGGPSLCA